MSALATGAPSGAAPGGDVVAGAMPGSDPIVTVEHVTLRFGGVTSLNDVSLGQARGEILAVIGPNGAGKTSLFNCLTGVYVPQRGSIAFRPAGEPAVTVMRAGSVRRPWDPSSWRHKPNWINRQGIARTFQASRLFGALSAFENVKIGVESRQRTGPIGAMLHLPRTRREERESDARTLELLDFVGLRALSNELASSLPYGAQRRLEIARALGTAPQLLLLDEPAAGTNPSEKLELAELIRRANTELGVSVLLIEHDMRLVMSLAQRIVVLNFGAVIAAGSPLEVQRNPAVVEAYLGSAAGEERIAALPGEAGNAAEAEMATTGEQVAARSGGAPGAAATPEPEDADWLRPASGDPGAAEPDRAGPWHAPGGEVP